MHTPATIDLSFLDEPLTPRRLASLRAVPARGPGPVGGWNAADAIRLEEAADATVARLRVSGLDPSMQAAAARCVDAHRRRDMFGVYDACRDIERRAQELSKAGDR